VKVVAHNLL